MLLSLDGNLPVLRASCQNHKVDRLRRMDFVRRPVCPVSETSLGLDQLLGSAAAWAVIGSILSSFLPISSLNPGDLRLVQVEVLVYLACGLLHLFTPPSF